VYVCIYERDFKILKNIKYDYKNNLTAVLLQASTAFYAFTIQDTVVKQEIVVKQEPKNFL
jgi:hypothetical protein